MININEAYQFFITFPDIGVTQVYPLNDELKWKWEEHRKLKAYSREIASDLEFGDNVHNTFNELKGLEEKTGLCYALPLLIKYRNNSGTWVDCYDGYIPFRKGKWLYSQGKYEVKPRSNSKINCVKEHWKVKKNLLDILQKVSVITYNGDVVTIQKTVGVANFTGVNPSREYLLNQARSKASTYGIDWTVTKVGLANVAINGNAGIVAEFARVESLSPVDPENWTLDGGVYVQPVFVKYDSYTVDPGPFPPNSWFVHELVNINLTNGITLESALNYLLEDCGLPVMSDFFNINPSGESIDLDEYVNAAEDYSNVVLFQASDIIRAGDATVATKLDKSLEQLVGDMFKKHPLFMFHDTVNGTIRIEHEAYRARRRMLDLTQNQYKKYLSGKREYEYDDNDFPILETYKDAFEAENTPDFTDATFKYDPSCASGNETEEEREEKLRFINYDVASIYKNEELITNKEVRTSIVMVALDGNNLIIRGKGAISGDTILNLPFANANILPRYRLRSRPILNGKMNDIDTVFKSTAPIRKQKTIDLTLSRDDYFESYHPDDLVNTQFGWGEVQGDEYTEPYNELELKIAHRLTLTT